MTESDKKSENTEKKPQTTGADPEILKKEGAPCRPLWLAEKENFRFQMI